MTHSDCLVLILKFYSVRMPLHDVENFPNKRAFSSKHVSIFVPRKYDVISKLRDSYAKDPFCVKRLIYNRSLYVNVMYVKLFTSNMDKLYEI